MTSRWYGKIGFGTTEEIKRGLWKTKIEERMYYGDVITVRQVNENQSYSSNDNLIIKSKISILDDGFIGDNLSSIRYVEFKGAKWKVIEISPEGHRLILTLGGVYIDNSNK